MANASSCLQRPVAVPGRRLYPNVDAATSSGVDKWKNYNAECDAPPIAWDKALATNDGIQGFDFSIQRRPTPDGGASHSAL